MDDTIYDELGATRVINAAGQQTRIGGTLIRDEALEAMDRAGRHFASLSSLQASASRVIREATGADAGYVTNGGASALTMASAACIAGDNYGVMDRLPHCEGVPNEILIPRAHRNEYDVAFRAGGARLRSVGVNDHVTGRESVKRWELEKAISEETVAFAYVARPWNELDLETVVSVAHDNDLPVIVDAAAELPPKANLTAFVDCGADAVAFSGGKAIRGPQSSGFLAATTPIIRSVALQHLPSDTNELTGDLPAELVGSKSITGLPNHGIGRPMKVGKEEIAGFVRALEAFLEEDTEALLEEWNDRSRRIATELARVGGLSVSLTNPDDSTAVSEVVVEAIGDDAVSLPSMVLALREGDPSIYVRERHVDSGRIFINPKCLDDRDCTFLLEHIREYVDSESH